MRLKFWFTQRSKKKHFRVWKFSFCLKFKRKYKYYRLKFVRYPLSKFNILKHIFMLLWLCFWVHVFSSFIQVYFLFWEGFFAFVLISNFNFRYQMKRSLVPLRIFPLIAWLLSNFSLLEKRKHPNFCSTALHMQLGIQIMRDSKNVRDIRLSFSSYDHTNESKGIEHLQSIIILEYWTQNFMYP